MLKVIGASWYQTKIITMVLGALVALGIVAFIFGENDRVEEDGNYSATVYWHENSAFRISFWGQGNNLEEVPKGMARAHYKTDINTNGWAIFEVQTQEDSPDWKQAYAAGFLEGSLSWQLIYWHWANTVRDTCDGRPHFCQQVRDFLEQNSQWVRDTARKLEDEDPFWHQVHLFYMQLEGLEHGWNKGMERSRQEKKIPSIDFLWMNVLSDLADLEQKFNSSSEDPNDPFHLSVASGLSSAFVKLLPDTRQLLFAHNSGGLYQSMLKMLKRYELNYHATSAAGAPVVPGRVTVFSSYPAAIHSQDDLYLVSGARENGKGHQLAVSGAAIYNNNKALWNKTQPLDQVLIGPRVMSANRLAKCGRTWARELRRYNSGTGNKQWLIADYGRLATRPAPPELHEGSPRRLRAHQEVKGLLWVVEQLPELMHSSDQTRHLQKAGYWAAYGGVPFHEDIAEQSHAKLMEELYGTIFSHERSPIAKIFRRDQINATDLSSTIDLMRSNQFPHDPLNMGNPLQAVSGRGDLSEPSVPPRPMGAVDTKVFVGAPGKPVEFQAVAGPTFSSNDDFADDGDDNDVAYNYVSDFNRPQVPPFQWSNSIFNKLSHIGQPDVWHFQPIQVQPNWVWTQKYEESL